MRYDAGDFTSPVRTPNGYLRCDAHLTRVGVFEYRLGSGKVRRELRLPEEVFKSDSLASFDDVPLTNEHPRERLDSKNTRRYQAGTVRDARRDGDHVAARVLITDSDVIAAAEQGKTQVSCGYTCDVVEQQGITAGIPGVQDGLTYDAIQRNIVGNHVAIVDRARAGATATLHLDADDAVMVTRSTSTNPAGPAPGQAVRSRPMAKVRIDEVDFEMEEGASQAVSKLLARADQAAEELAKAKKELAEQKARADTAVEGLEAAKKEHADAVAPDKVREMVNARVALETTAAKVIADDKVKLDEMSDDAIRKAVVLKVSPSAKEKLDDADATYIAARFDAAVESWKQEQDRKPSASHAVKGAAAASGVRTDSAQARRKMIASNLIMGTEAIRPSTPN